MTEKTKPLDLNDAIAKAKIEMLHNYKEFGIKRKELDNILFFFIQDLKEELKQHIKQACEFFLRYKERPNDLILDFPEFTKEVNNIRLKYIDEHGNLQGSMIFHFLSDYNEWLFKLAFKGAIKDARV